MKLIYTKSEIPLKFRGMDHPNQTEWHYGEFINDSNECYIIDDQNKKIKIIPDTLTIYSNYTLNGTELYENDIIRIYESENEYYDYVIEFMSDDEIEYEDVLYVNSELETLTLEYAAGAWDKIKIENIGTIYNAYN